MRTDHLKIWAWHYAKNHQEKVRLCSLQMLLSQPAHRYTTNTACQEWGNSSGEFSQGRFHITFIWLVQSLPWGLSQKSPSFPGFVWALNLMNCSSSREKNLCLNFHSLGFAGHKQHLEEKDSCSMSTSIPQGLLPAGEIPKLWLSLTFSSHIWCFR